MDVFKMAALCIAMYCSSVVLYLSCLGKQ